MLLFFLNRLLLNRRLSSLLLSFLAVFILTACGHTTLPVRDAEALASKTAFTYERFGVCWPGELDRSGIADPVPPPGANEFTAGFHNHVARGQSCHTQQSHAYSGAFRFNIEDLRNKAIASAMLRIERRNTLVEISVERAVPSGVVRDNRCTLLVEMATEDWPAGLSAGNFASRPIPTSFPATIDQSRSMVSGGIDVTRVLQQWSIGRMPNFGFVIKPQASDIDKNENTCTGYWFNPRLEITVLERTAD